MRSQQAEILSGQEIGRLLMPYMQTAAPDQLCGLVARYLDLLTHWNARISLTSVREPAQIVQRHFGESFFLAERLPAVASLLDLGSGAGFPGIPVALLHRDSEVTLAESQQKKVAFLREVVWSLKLNVKIWGQRVEQMPESQNFDVVALRAVDNMESALLAAVKRVKPGGTLAFFAGEGTPFPLQRQEWQEIVEHPLPLSSGKLVIARAI